MHAMRHFIQPMNANVIVLWFFHAHFHLGLYGKFFP
jgi:hypothetical protein